MEQELEYNVELPEDNIYTSKCPILYALNTIGSKWKLPILWYLYRKDKIRYNELKRSVTGITDMMLTKSLQELESSHLVVRRQYETIPPHVEYSLTERGIALIPTLNELYQWGSEQILIDENGQQ